jgi:methyltransferase (TIGR00027 family)
MVAPANHGGGNVGVVPRGAPGVDRSPAKRSRTAQGVVAERAVLADMGVVVDPFAHHMLVPSMSAVLGILRCWPIHKLRAKSVTLAGLAARVLWYDAQVAEALDEGIAQVALIGAGYDSRAWRFRRDGVTYFELDQRATQQDKVRRAPRPGPTYVEADLGTRGAAEALRERGLDASCAALFVIEGLTMYLSEGVVRHQLTDLAKASAEGSRLAIDFHPPSHAGTARDHRQLRLQRLARAGSGESFKLLVNRAEAIELVEDAGWTVKEEMSMREAARTLVPRESGLPVNAINEHKTLVAAVRS